MLFAGQSYVDYYGIPQTKEELLNIVCAAGGGSDVNVRKLMNGFFPVFHKWIRRHAYECEQRPRWAIENGVGIGWVPTYFTRSARKMVPVDIAEDFQVPFDIWLTYHLDAGRNSARPKMNRLDHRLRSIRTISLVRRRIHPSHELMKESRFYPCALRDRRVEAAFARRLEQVHVVLVPEGIRY